MTSVGTVRDLANAIGRGAMNWDDYKNEFDADGGLRGIYVNDTSLKDWQRFVDYLRKTEARLEYFVDNEVQALPAQIDEISQSREHVRLLSIDLGGVSMNCHFFILDQIKEPLNKS